MSDTLKPWAGVKSPIHWEVGPKNLAACGGPYANYEWRSPEVEDVTCRECLALLTTATG